jgi:hypothetical protein
MRAFRMSLVGTFMLVLLGGPGGVVAVEEDPVPPVDGQTIAEMVNAAVNGCDVVDCDAAPFEAVYAPDVRLVVDGEVYAEGLDGMRSMARTADRNGATFRLIAPVAEYHAGDGDLYLAMWVEVTGPAGLAMGDPILSLMQVRDGKVITQVDGGLPDAFTE